MGPLPTRALHHNLVIVDRVREIANRLDATPAQVALARIVSRGQFVVPIPGTETLKYLTENAGAGQLVLTSETLSELDVLPRPSR
jgi:aryl-alcohol dehydrogenase-like predicted oxidoreductase